MIFLVALALWLSAVVLLLLFFKGCDDGFE